MKRSTTISNNNFEEMRGFYIEIQMILGGSKDFKRFQEII